MNKNEILYGTTVDSVKEKTLNLFDKPFQIAAIKLYVLSLYVFSKIKIKKFNSLCPFPVALTHKKKG